MELKIHRGFDLWASVILIVLGSTMFTLLIVVNAANYINSNKDSAVKIYIPVERTVATNLTGPLGDVVDEGFGESEDDDEDNEGGLGDDLEDGFGYADGGLGDVNCDGQVDQVDAEILFNHVFNNGDEPVCVENGDMNEDGDLGVVDVLLILEEALDVPDLSDVVNEGFGY